MYSKSFEFTLSNEKVLNKLLVIERREFIRRIDSITGNNMNQNEC